MNQYSGIPFYINQEPGKDPFEIIIQTIGGIPIVVSNESERLLLTGSEDMGVFQLEPPGVYLFKESVWNLIGTSGSSGGGGGSSVIDVTYSDLVDKIDSGELIVGQTYILTDFQFVGQIGEVTYSSSIIEPLILTATSTSSIDIEAKSTVYENEYIHYSVTGGPSFEQGGRGAVLRRINKERNVDVGWDYRFEKTSGYLLDFSSIPTWEFSTIYTKYEKSADPSTSVIQHEGYIYISTIDANTETTPGTDASRWQKVLPFVTSSYFAKQIEFLYNDNIGDYVIKPSVSDVHIIPTILDSFVNPNTSSAHINIDFRDIYIKDGRENLINGSGFYKIHAPGSEFRRNMLDSAFNNNVIGNEFTDNLIGSDSEYNNIQSEFVNNVIDTSFRRNETGLQFKDNIISSNFSTNKTGIYFAENIIGNSFFRNIVNDDFYGNKIKDSFTDNKIFGIGFTDNDIGSSFVRNVINQSFDTNVIGDGFYNVTTEFEVEEVDFSSSTFIGQNFSKTIYRRPDGTLKMRYYDDTDTLVIVDPND